MSSFFVFILRNLLLIVPTCAIIKIQKMKEKIMNNSQLYEKVVKLSNTKKVLIKKISVCMCYVVLLFVFVILAIFNYKSFGALFIFLGAVLELAVIMLTWKYLSVEYEYSFACGEMTVSKIYSKRKRRTVFTAEIKKLAMIAPATEAYIAKSEHFSPQKRIIAVSSESADNIWLAVTGDDSKKREIVFFEADECSLAILKSINPSAYIKG